MIYFCDPKVNSLPNQKLLYEKENNIISDTCMCTSKFVSLFFKLYQKDFSYLFQKETENVHCRHRCHENRNHRSLANQKTGNIFS